MTLPSALRSSAAILAAAAALLGSPASARAASRFEREVERLAALLEVGPGSVVADVGAGDGDYALALARRVGPEGRVYATEIDAGLRERIARAAGEAGLANVVVVEARVDASGLPDACCDAAFLRGVYHHLTQPEPTLASLRAALRPGGRLVVIDFRPTRWLALWKPEGVPADRGGHGVPPELVERECAAAGFERLALDEAWPAGWLYRLYALSFRRP
jgi:ubiquinone/menaquinone biosynthesis C-methylase UbiE